MQKKEKDRQSNAERKRQHDKNMENTKEGVAKKVPNR